MKTRLKAGHTRWLVTQFGVLALQLVSRKYRKTGMNGWLTRSSILPAIIASDRAILKQSFPTYRKALQSVIRQKVLSNLS